MFSRFLAFSMLALLFATRGTAQDTSNPLGESTVVYTMRFQVVDRSVQPVRNALVDLYNFSGVKAMSAMTNAEGRVAFRMGPGTYTITVRGNDIKDAKIDFRVEVFDGDRFEQISVERKSLATSIPPAGVVTAATAAIPEKARAEFVKGEAKLKQKDYQGAKAEFQKATREYAHYAEAFNGIGIAELRLHDVAAAEKAFQDAIAADAQHPTGYLNIGKLYILQRDAAKALPFLEKAVSLNPGDPEGQAQLSFAQFAMGDCKSALASAARAHSAGNRQGELGHLVAGACYESAGDAEKARSEYRLYLAESPTGPQAAQAKAGLDRLQAPK